MKRMRTSNENVDTGSFFDTEDQIRKILKSEVSESSTVVSVGRVW